MRCLRRVTRDVETGTFLAPKARLAWSRLANLASHCSGVLTCPCIGSHCKSSLLAPGH